MTKLATIGIVAHVERRRQASQLESDTQADYAAEDTGELGCRGNHVRVWTWLAESDTSWALVLEDDAQPVSACFRQQLDAALMQAPTPIVSLYLGTGNPGWVQKDIPKMLRRADKAQAHWVTSRYLWHGVAVAMRTELIAPMLRHIIGWRNLPIDDAITKFAIHQNYRVSYTLPSLVDHADGPILAVHPDKQRRTRKRVAWQTGQRDQWNSKTVEL